MLPPGVLHMSALGCFGRFTLFSPRVSHSNTCRCLVLFLLCFGSCLLGWRLCYGSSTSYLMTWLWIPHASSWSSTYECVELVTFPPLDTRRMLLRTFHPLLTSRFTFQHLPSFVFCLFCVLVWSHVHLLMPSSLAMDTLPPYSSPLPHCGPHFTLCSGHIWLGQNL